MNILEVLRERKLASLKSSVTFSEAVEQRVQDHAKHVKQVLTGEVPREDVTPEDNMRKLYYQMLEDYKQTKNIALSQGPMSTRSKLLWGRVVKASSRVSISPEKYMRAQFQWFHDTFKRAPEITQLSTEAAVQRAMGHVEKSAFKIIGNDIDAGITLSAILTRSEKNMQDLMRHNKYTREEVYQKLVLTGLITFPAEFLRADPVYKKLIK